MLNRHFGWLLCFMCCIYGSSGKRRMMIRGCKLHSPSRTISLMFVNVQTMDEEMLRCLTEEGGSRGFSSQDLCLAIESSLMKTTGFILDSGVPLYHATSQPFCNPLLSAFQTGNQAIWHELMGRLGVKNSGTLLVDRTGRTVADLMAMDGTSMNPSTSDKFKSKSCDIVVVNRCDMNYDRFVTEFVLPSRPVLVRNCVQAIDMNRYSETTLRRAWKTRRWKVGRNAYPSLTGQRKCSQLVTMEDLINGRRCDGDPALYATHVRKGKEEDYYVKKSDPTWRFVENLTRYDRIVSNQFFMGGNESGASFHHHGEAFNILYTGTKEWFLSVPTNRGWSGEPSTEMINDLDPRIQLRCTQEAGDILFLPRNWGHMTYSHGFTVGFGVNYRSPTPPKPVLFVHINKTGGSSVIKHLKTRCASSYNARDAQFTFHASALRQKRALKLYEWDDTYRFTMVRNPFHRMISNYYFLNARYMGVPYRGLECGKRCTGGDRRLINATSIEDEEVARDRFNAWVNELDRAYPMGTKDAYLFGSLGHGNQIDRGFNETQTSWLVDSHGTMLVENHIHLESLDEEWGGQGHPCLRSKPLREHLKRIGHPSPRNFMTTETADIIRRRFHVDFVNFGYSKYL